MTKLSKINLDPNKFGHYVNNLWSAFTLMETKEDIRFLFKDLFTHTEYKMFTKRLEIARRLLQGQTYDEIKKDLKVTATTIASVNNTLTLKGGGYRKAHDKLKNLELKHQRKIAERQDYIEHRKRRKLPGETLLFELVTEGMKAADRKLTKISKIKSANKHLDV